MTLQVYPHFRIIGLKKAHKKNAKANKYIPLNIVPNVGLIDTKEVVQVLTGDYDCSIYLIILDIKALPSLFHFVDFDYIFMTLNGQPHMFAKFCYLIC